MSTFDIETDILREEGANFVSVGTTFGAASKKLQDDLAAQGEPWSTDDLGEMFGTFYTPIRDGMFTSMDSLGEQLQSMGRKLQDMARKYESSDMENVHTLDTTYV